MSPEKTVDPRLSISASSFVLWGFSFLSLPASEVQCTFCFFFACFNVILQSFAICFMALFSFVGLLRRHCGDSTLACPLCVIATVSCTCCMPKSASFLFWWAPAHVVHQIKHRHEHIIFCKKKKILPLHDWLIWYCLAGKDFFGAKNTHDDAAYWLSTN